jgi:hypothetical protein
MHSAAAAIATIYHEMIVVHVVQTERTQCEQMSSGLLLKADTAQCSRHFAFVHNNGLVHRNKMVLVFITSYVRLLRAGWIVMAAHQLGCVPQDILRLHQRR